LGGNAVVVEVILHKHPVRWFGIGYNIKDDEEEEELEGLTVGLFDEDELHPLRVEIKHLPVA
jgi:hypothetical protein